MAGISQLCNQFMSQPELFEVLHEKDLQLKFEKPSEQINNDREQIEELSVSTISAPGKLKEEKRTTPP